MLHARAYAEGAVAVAVADDVDDRDEDEGEIRLSNTTVKIHNIHNNGALCISMRIQNISQSILT